MASLIQDSLQGSRQAPHDVQSLADLVGLLNPFLLTHPVLQLLLIFVASTASVGSISHALRPWCFHMVLNSYMVLQ